MGLINLEQVTLSLGHHLLLNKITCNIDHRDKIGLIGRNGSGKSSLLKVLSGMITVDSGQLNIAQETKIVYVAQEPQLNDSNTIWTEVFAGLGDLQQVLTNYYQLLEDMECNFNSSMLLQLTNLQEQLEHSNIWEIKSLIDKVLTNLNLKGNMIIGDLSGGLKKKVALAKALIAQPDVLLLDEPTNHLDIETIECLENIIHDFNGTIILITHDRVFLDKTVNKIIELDRGLLHSYPGNFATYQVWKTQQLAVEEKINHEFDKFLNQEEVWIRKGIEARRIRNEGRVRRLTQLRLMKNNRRTRLGTVNLQVDRGELSGKLIAELHNINFSYADRIILNNVSTKIMRQDKIGIIGANGVGKSTLLKIILGQLQPLSGVVKLGDKLEIAYFDQFRETLDEDASLADVVSQGQDFVNINGRKLHIARYLEEFLFEPQRFSSPVKSLSGGERNRLFLARLFSRPANVLVLDEPTNDLDMETLELLEDMLVKYTGTVFLVSHDRAFLDNVVTHSYVFLGNGNLVEINGGYTDWIEYKQAQDQKTVSSSIKMQKNVENIPTNIVSTKSQHQSKLSYKEKRELDELFIELDKLEQEQVYLQQQLTDGNLYKLNVDLAKQYQLRMHHIEQEVKHKLLRWEDLESRC